ncbi:hypothetical protein BJY01DRAFT_253575 [Aspergillus pseudoustus]|uniref:Uncharacterized protein n=1 Tax=Aspergillus pseudoustus TaxID=1810923 RepID=A0ABR4J272_9EURO
MVRAAAKNRANGKAIIQLYLNTLDRDSHIGVDFIASLVRYFDVEIMELLTNRCGNDKIGITKSIVSALSRNRQHGQHIMALLMDREANHTQILTSFLNMNFREWRNTEKLLKAFFHPIPRKVLFEKSTAVNARGNQPIGEELLEMLLDLPTNHLSVDAEAFIELCRTFDAQIVGRVFLEHGNGQIKVTEAVMEAACSNQRHAESLVGLFLEHINSITGMQLTNRIATAAATNQRSNRTLLKRLLAHPQIKLTWQGASRVVLYADSDTIRWFSQSQAGDPALRVTAQVISDAAAANRGLEMLTLLMAPLTVNLDIVDTAVARFFEIYDQNAVEDFIRLRGDLVSLTVPAIQAVCSKFGYQTISLLLRKQRSRGRLEKTDVWIKELHLNATMSQKEKSLIMDDFPGERRLGDYHAPAPPLSELEKLSTDEIFQAIIAVVIISMCLDLILGIVFKPTRPKNLPPGPRLPPPISSTQQDICSELGEWHARHGPIIGHNFGSKTIISLGTAGAVSDLLQERSEKYAVRRWSVVGKYFTHDLHPALNEDMSSKYELVQNLESMQLLRDLTDPGGNSISTPLQRTAYGVTWTMAFGDRLASANDLRFRELARITSDLNKALEWPLVHQAEMFPWLDWALTPIAPWKLRGHIHFIKSSRFFNKWAKKALNSSRGNWIKEASKTDQVLTDTDIAYLIGSLVQTSVHTARILENCVLVALLHPGAVRKAQ